MGMAWRYKSRIGIPYSLIKSYSECLSHFLHVQPPGAASGCHSSESPVFHRDILASTIIARISEVVTSVDGGNGGWNRWW